MITKEQHAALNRPFAPSEIEWRVGQAGTGARGPWIKVLAYLTSRAVMDRLDEVFGPGGWSHSLREVHVGNVSGMICRLEAGGVAHEDVADCSDIEALKGAASGALKRAAVHFGVGRYLYFLSEGWANIHERGRFSHKLKEGGFLKWDPPALPEWALPPEGSVPFNPFAQHGEAPIPESKESDGPALVVPEGIPADFLAMIETVLKDPEGAKKLRDSYAKAQEKGALLGLTFLPIDPRAFPVDIANALLVAKKAIMEAEGASK
jgi:hypothetical protein